MVASPLILKPFGHLHKQTEVTLTSDNGFHSFQISSFSFFSPPAGAPIKSIFVQKGHAIHHFYEIFELISTMWLLKW